MTEDLAHELAAIRAVLDDHERRLFPVNRRGLPPPTGRIDRPHVGMVGDCWDVPGPTPRVRGWKITCLDQDEDGYDSVYIHTPHSLYEEDSGDTVAMRPAEARLLAASILAAVDRIEQRSGRTVVPLRGSETA